MKISFPPASRTRSGRPPKFSGPSRPVTLTLPESTLEGLRQIHEDRGHAIVKLTESALRKKGAPFSLVEIIKVAEGTGLIMVGQSKSLRGISFLHLLEVAPGRFLLALDPGNDFHALELAVQDVLDDLPAEDESERGLLTKLQAHIRKLRKAAQVQMAEILFVSLGSKNGSRAA